LDYPKRMLIFVSHIIKTYVMKPNRTQTSTGIELSLMFIGEDGTLSMFLNNDECQIVGGISTIFGDGWSATKK